MSELQLLFNEKFPNLGNLSQLHSNEPPRSTTTIGYQTLENFCKIFSLDTLQKEVSPNLSYPESHVFESYIEYELNRFQEFIDTILNMPPSNLPLSGFFNVDSSFLRNINELNWIVPSIIGNYRTIQIEIELKNRIGKFNPTNTKGNYLYIKVKVLPESAIY